MRLALLAFVVGALALGQEIAVKYPASHVEFLAIGRPSAIKIRGKISDEAKDPLSGKLPGKISLKVDSLDTGIGMRDRHMKEKYLETAKYPLAELTVEKLPATSGPFEGKLLLHGVTKPVHGTAEIAGKGLALDFKIKVSDYGIEIPTYMGISVADEVTVTAKAEPSSLAE